MGGMLHLFDFNQGEMAKKVFTQKRHTGGLETPRNSLDLQLEASQRYRGAGELPHTYLVKEEHSDKYYPNEASMKTLIDEEMSKHSNTRKNAPSIVARLMGMDMFPSDTKSEVQPKEKNDDSIGVKLTKKELNRRGLNDQVSPKNSSFHNMEKDYDEWSSNQKFEKARRREHPQEEELQKFKKEFESWQAARFRECSRTIELSNMNSQLLVQEDLNKERMAYYKIPGLAYQKPLDPKDPMREAGSYERAGLQSHGNKMALSRPEKNKSASLRSQTINNDREHPSLLTSYPTLDKSSIPTRIVILKPGPDKICHHEDHWTSSSGTPEERSTNIKDFLEEVKERLKCELQGKNTKKGSAIRGRGIETPYSEKPSGSKQIAQHIAKQVRESVSKDIGVTLLRSESARSSRTEIQFNSQDSPEFINRDNSRLFSERLRNVVKREADLDSGCSGSSVLGNERALKQINDSMKDGKEKRYLGIVRDVEEMQTRSFRHGSDDTEVLNRDMTPGNLVRSLSAPVSGTSFGKLLLEDRHILTGAHVQRKHEAIENVLVDLKRQKKEKFNFIEKVSNLKYNFILRGRLFGRKAQSMDGLDNSEHYHVKDIMTGPTVLMNTGGRHVKENDTEVPPSPASMCNSAQEEFWRPAGHLSPISTSVVTPRENNTMPHVFRDISSNLNELRRRLNQLESDDFEDKKAEQLPVEHGIVEIGDSTKAYIRDLLVASGLYDGSPGKFLSRWDAFSKPINNSIFEEVEESYRKLAENESSVKDQCEKKADHMVLLDLLNETLSALSRPPLTISTFGRKTINSSMLPPLSGRRLLDSAWDIIRVYVYPPTESSYYSLDSMVARDLNATPWSALVDDEVNAMGREIESVITRDLVEEILKDMLLL